VEIKNPFPRRFKRRDKFKKLKIKI